MLRSSRAVSESWNRPAPRDDSVTWGPDGMLGTTKGEVADKCGIAMWGMLYVSISLNVWA